MRLLELVGTAATACLLGFGLGACSDDGLTTDQNAESGGDDGGRGSTTGSSVSTTATATLPTSAGESGADTNDPSAGSTAGLDDGGTTGGLGDDSGTDSGGAPPGECVIDADCVVVEDCCACDAVPADDVPRGCPKACAITACGAAGIEMPQAHCNFGHCELVPQTCNPIAVSCESLPPDCPDGTLPGVDFDCWSGHCVPGHLCDVVPSCDWCEADETCVLTGTQIGVYYACEPIDPSCGGTPDCACMGAVCSAPFQCGPGMGATPLECFCPVCD
jgi:hypothetical protein